MRVIFSKLAKQELDDATRYYEVELQGFGKLFREEVRKTAKKEYSISRGMVCRTRRCQEMSSTQVSIQTALFH